MVQDWFGARGTTTCMLFLCKPEVWTDAQLQWVNVTLDHQMESAAKNTLLEVTVPSQGWKRETPALLFGSTWAANSPVKAGPVHVGPGLH